MLQARWFWARKWLADKPRRWVEPESLWWIGCRQRAVIPEMPEWLEPRWCWPRPEREQNTSLENNKTEMVKKTKKKKIEKKTPVIHWNGFFSNLQSEFQYLRPVFWSWCRCPARRWLRPSWRWRSARTSGLPAWRPASDLEGRPAWARWPARWRPCCCTRFWRMNDWKWKC